MSFRLARMCRVILILTLGLMTLPVVLLAASFWGSRLLAVPALSMAAIYAWIWLRFRPVRFLVSPEALEVVWPLKRRLIARSRILNVRLIDRAELGREVGWGVRVGAGGLWGGFGWLWTRRRGIVQMYISRIDRFVWIELARGRPWLITPERPETFVETLR